MECLLICSNILGKGSEKNIGKPLPIINSILISSERKICMYNQSLSTLFFPSQAQQLYESMKLAIYKTYSTVVNIETRLLNIYLN